MAAILTVGTQNFQAFLKHFFTHRIYRFLTGMTDDTATTVATLTIPNAICGGMIRVTAVGTLGDGDSSHAVVYNIAFSRIAGAAAKAIAAAVTQGTAVITGASANATTVVAVATGVTTVTLPNTFTISVKVTKSTGSSALHFAAVELLLLDCDIDGVSLV
jgi:hypothetical protein